MSYLEIVPANEWGSLGFSVKVKKGHSHGIPPLRPYCTCMALWDWDTHEWHWADHPGPCSRSSEPTDVIGPGPMAWRSTHISIGKAVNIEHASCIGSLAYDMHNVHFFTK